MFPPRLFSLAEGGTNIHRHQRCAPTVLEGTSILHRPAESSMSHHRERDLLPVRSLLATTGY